MDDNREVDFTIEQFPQGTKICVDEVRVDKVGAGDEENATPQRYDLLKKRVEEHLNS